MDEFLRIIYDVHMQEPERGNKCYDDFFKPFFERLGQLVSPQLYNELDELFTECAIFNNNYYGVEGMKLAIDVMEKKYLQRV